MRGKALICLAMILLLFGCKDKDAPPCIVPLYYGRCVNVATFAGATMNEHGHEVEIWLSVEANHVECRALVEGEWKWIRLGGCASLGYGVAAYDEPVVPMPDPEIYTFQQWKSWGF